MPKALSEAAIRQYRDQGYYFPVPVLSAAIVTESGNVTPGGNLDALITTG